MSLFQPAAGIWYTSARDFHPTAGHCLIYKPPPFQPRLEPGYLWCFGSNLGLSSDLSLCQQPEVSLRSGLERRPHLDGTDPAVRWNPLRRRQEASSAVRWQEFRSGLETFPQWAGKFCHLTTRILGIWTLP